MTNTKAVQIKAKATTIDLVGLTAGAMAKPVDEAKAKALTEAVASSKAAGDRVAGSIMWDAALLFTNMVDYSNLVRTGPATDKDDTRMMQGDYASALGFSKSYGSRLVRLGRAAQRHGVRKGSPEWRLLASKASGTDFADTLGLSLEKYTATKAATDKRFTEVLTAMLKGDKPKAVEAPKAKPDEGDKVESDKGSGKSDTGKGDGVPSTPADLRMVVAQVIVPGLKRLSDTEAEVVYREVLAAVASDKDRRAVEAKAREAAKAKAIEHGDDGQQAKPVRPKATPATVAKATATKPKATEPAKA